MVNPHSTPMTKAAKALEKTRRKAYSVFLRVNHATTLDQLVLPFPNDRVLSIDSNSSSSSSSNSTAYHPESSSPWLWLVNLGESGGDLEGKRRLLEQTIPDDKDAWCWIPLLGSPYSLLRFSTASQALYALSHHNASLASSITCSSSSSHLLAATLPTKPLFLELCPSSIAQSKLALTPTTRDAVEFAPGRLRWPCGLEVWLDYVSPEQETLFISKMREEGGWKADDVIDKRLSVHYGPHFDYSTNAVKELVRPLPEYIQGVLGRLPYQDEKERPDQMTGQVYPPGSGIPPHVDTHSPFGPVIWGISLGSTVVMELKACGEVEAARMRLAKRSLADGGDEGNKATVIRADATLSTGSSSSSQVIILPSSPPPLSHPAPSPSIEEVPTSPPLPLSESQPILLVDLPPRSLLIMKGPSRYAFTHAIRPRRLDPTGDLGENLRERGVRYSLTFRSIVKELEEVVGPEEGSSRWERRQCRCVWGSWCDSQMGGVVGGGM